VPYDFDWTSDHAITDKWFASFYAQLPYEAQFIAIFDCCHSGGMTRAGARVRGLTPPDDIRHRALKWNSRQRAWETRKFEAWNKELGLPPRLARRGLLATKRRLGYASDARIVSSKDQRYRSLRRDFGHKGPYMPILFEACQEDQLAYEYKDGATSYGAFTYFLAQTVRARGRQRQSLTFDNLIDEAAAAVGNVYAQTPQLECPTNRRGESILGPHRARQAGDRTPARSGSRSRRRTTKPR